MDDEHKIFLNPTLDFIDIYCDYEYCVWPGDIVYSPDISLERVILATNNHDEHIKKMAY